MYRLELLENNFMAICLTFLLSAGPNITDLLQREHPQILAGIGVGYSASIDARCVHDSKYVCLLY